MPIQLRNNAASRLASNISASDTTIVVQAGQGGRFPALSAGNWFPITVIRPDNTLEIMRVTARSGNVLTVERAQEGTTAIPFLTGDRVELRLTTGALDGRISDALVPLQNDISKNASDISAQGALIQANANAIASHSNTLTSHDDSIERLGRETRSFAGVDDPADDPSNVLRQGMTWADMGNMRLKRWRNANARWQDEGPLYRPTLPLYDNTPNNDQGGPIYRVGIGPMEWNGSAYELVHPLDPALIQWLGTPIGSVVAMWDHYNGVVAPPTNNPLFRYVRLTAGDSYNAGLLTNETVTGTAPNITARAQISWSESPMNGRTINLINTSRPFLRPGESSNALIGSQNLAHSHGGTTNNAGGHSHSYQMVGGAGSGSDLAGGGSQGTRGIVGGTTGSVGGHSHNVTIDSHGGDEARPRNIGITYYLRIK